MGPLTGVGMTGMGKNRQFSYLYPYPHFTRTHTCAGYPNPCSCLVTISTLASIRSPFIQKHHFLALLSKLLHCIASPVLVSLLAASSSRSWTLPFIICHAPFSSVAALLSRTHVHHFHLGRLVMVTMFLVHYVFMYTVANVDQPAWANIISHDLASSSITWCDLARLR